MTLSLLALAALAAPEPQLIVQLKPGADPVTVAALANVTLRATTPNAPFALYGVSSGTAEAAQMRLVADAAHVVWAEDNAEVGSPENAAVRGGAIQKGSSLGVIGGRTALVQRNANALAQVDWSAALAASPGRMVRLAVLDTGLSRSQTGLWAKVDLSMDAFGGDADDAAVGIDTNGNGIKDEAVGHGTMVAGIVDAVAPQVRLVVAKIADSDGRATAWSVVQGLAFAANAGAEVANLSMGSAEPVAAFNDMAEWCESKGLLVVAPAGNAGTDRLWYPARSSKALSVAGLTATNVKAGFSNYEGGVDASAPAVGIVSQWWDGGLAAWSGTSFAAPFVSGGLADCLRRTNRRSPSSLVRAVTDSGQNVDRLNDKKLKDRIGPLLDIASLDRKLQGKP